MITLIDRRELVARVARRFMPRLKTESEIATLQYLRDNTPVPVPTVYHYDSNPYNRLGGEYILMSKVSNPLSICISLQVVTCQCQAPGIPLSKVYHSMSHDQLVSLLRNIVSLIIPLFSHRFSQLGSLYFAPSAKDACTSSSRTPTATTSYPSFAMSRQLSVSSAYDISTPKAPPQRPSLARKDTIVGAEYHVGPIISWPFFGSNRGDDEEIDRGPWPTTHAYLLSCMEREINGVIRESEGKAAPHRLHLDPDEIQSSRHHHLQAVPGDESDDSEEWDLEESEEEWDGPGDTMYRDYRRMQRTTFLIAHVVQREDAVRKEMERWIKVMERLGAGVSEGQDGIFGLDCHDLSLENIFVDEEDCSKIVSVISPLVTFLRVSYLHQSCVIDWESTTTRPLWACAHLPAFLLSSPFTAKLFRDAVAKLGEHKPSASVTNNGWKPDEYDLARLAKEWLFYERHGTRLRMAHRCAEWDGWEEGLVESILGPEETQDEWFQDYISSIDVNEGFGTPPLSSPGGSQTSRSEDILVANIKRRKPAAKLPFAKEEEKEQMLNTTGDICGGRGGELGRRLEAWLSVNGIENGETHKLVVRKWGQDDDMDYEAEAE